MSCNEVANEFHDVIDVVENFIYGEYMDHVCNSINDKLYDIKGFGTDNGVDISIDVSEFYQFLTDCEIRLTMADISNKLISEKYNCEYKVDSEEKEIIVHIFIEKSTILEDKNLN